MSKIILDPTELYQPLVAHIVITNEREWLQQFTLEDSAYWIKGKRLCNWTEEWLRIWNKLDLIIEIKRYPRPILEDIFSPLSIPNDWDDKLVLQTIIQLDSYNLEHPIESLLADVTNTEEHFWLTDNISVEHLAKWLCIEVPKNHQIFEAVWKNHISQFDNNLLSYYQIDNKHEVLLNWLGLSENLTLNDALGQYPLDIPNICLEEFRNFWREKIYQTEARILDDLILYQQAGQEIIVSITYEILLNRPIWITQERISKISSYLSKSQKFDLEQKLPPIQPLPLSIDASPQDALKWVTQSYLPFRRWETSINYTTKKQQISEKLADDFVNWMLKHYPELKMDKVEKSFLNYNVAFKVQELAKNDTIIWVVVDGLGWLDHQELIAILTEDNQLSLETNITPLFSILPTKTEYAKWSLYSQLLPENSSWKPNAKDGFSLVESGKRYTDSNKHQLNQDLKENKYKIYCWDTNELDELYHLEKDWKTLYNVERITRLQGIARNIQYFLKEYSDSKNLKVVIASDHGQIMGEVQKISNFPEELQSKGRMAIGKIDDPNFIVLDARRFGLPHDISIVRSSNCISAFNYTKDKEVIGSHGGLFPEEVVVGFSVLTQSLKRDLVLVTCRGEGKAKQTGELQITIDNLNSVPLTNLYLYINELSDFKTGVMLDLIVTSCQKVTQNISFSEFPELPPDKNEIKINLSGQLIFNFANNNESGKSFISSDSYITIQQMFTSGIKGGLDDFL